MPPIDDSGREEHQDDLEDRLRRSLHEGAPGIDPESFLDDVHRGARGRRRRRVAGSVLATAAVVAVAAYGVGASGVLDDDATPAADRSPSVTDTAGTQEGTGTPTTADQTTGSTEPENKRRALSLSATDTDHQYILMAGRFGCGEGCLRAYTTADAGDTWSATAPLGLLPADPDPATKTANEIRFADTEDGWVYGGGLRSTHDGGSSWHKPSLPATGIVTHLEAWGPRVFAGVEDPSKGTVTVVHSDSDTDDWQVVDVGTPVRFLSQLALSENVTAVLAAPQLVSTANEILVSTDDGATWSGDTSPCEGRGYPTAISTSATSLWTVCAAGQDATAYVSTDDGVSWTSVSGSFSPGSLIQARDDNTAVVLDVNKSGATIVSVGGQPDRTLEGQGNYLPVGFTNPTTGYLESFDNRIVRTLDSGATWQPYPTP